MICLTTGEAWFYNQRWSCANSLQVGGKSLKSFEEWNFLGEKFLTIALSLKDMKLKLKSPMESFPSINLKSVAGCEHSWVKRPYSFKYGTRLSAVYAKWHWSIWYQIVSESWLSSKKNITLCLSMTAKYWILYQLLRYSCQQGLTKGASAVN